MLGSIVKVLNNELKVTNAGRTPVEPTPAEYWTEAERHRGLKLNAPKDTEVACEPMKTVVFGMVLEAETSVGWQSMVTVTVLIGVERYVLYMLVVPEIVKV